jgi:triosephosphate isomerase
MAKGAAKKAKKTLPKAPARKQQATAKAPGKKTPATSRARGGIEAAAKRPRLDPSLRLEEPKQVRVRPLVAGNWKMNGLQSSKGELQKLVKQLEKLGRVPCDVLVAPPVTLLSAFSTIAAKSSLALGAQDTHIATSGAYTGDVSAEMLKDAGAEYVIVGHSERRAGHGERDADVKAKAEAALRADLKPIICVGESEVERDAGWTIDVVSRQIAGSVPESATPDTVVIAYEPVWAIGSGRTPTSDEIRTVHAAIREALVRRLGESARGFRILYGGSVKPSNSAEILRIPGVDGALVGGASLKADDFLSIISAYTR